MGARPIAPQHRLRDQDFLRLISALSSPTIPRRKANTQTTKITPRITCTQEPTLSASSFCRVMMAIAPTMGPKIVPTPPTTFDDVAVWGVTIGNGKAIMWDYNNTYFTFPLMMAGGGYAFQKGADGNFNGKETGVNNEGAIAGAN